MNERQIRAALADIEAGAVWVTCQPVTRCAYCGCEGREPLEHSIPPVTVCANCGMRETERYTPEVLGAPLELLTLC